MVKHTRAVVPTIKDEKAAKAFVIHLDENARNLLKDQIIQMEKLDELERQLEQLEKSVVATVGEYHVEDLNRSKPINIQNETIEPFWWNFD